MRKILRKMISFVVSFSFLSTTFFSSVCAQEIQMPEVTVENEVVDVTEDKSEDITAGDDTTVEEIPEIPEEETPPKEYGIDISVYQGDINWSELALEENNIDFVIMRAGTSWYGIDKNFEKNYAGVKSTGIKKGAYLYCSAVTLEGFKKAAYDFLGYLDGKEFEMPVYIDIEYSEQLALGKEKLTAYTLAAMNIISDAGYKTGVYTGKYWYLNHLDRAMIEKSGYEVWMAVYPSLTLQIDPLKYDYSEYCDIWQYSSIGTKKGIPAVVDLNIAYTIYPEPIEDKKELLDEIALLKSGNKLDFRCGAGTDFANIMEIDSRTVVEVKEQKEINGVVWNRIKYNGLIGWCKSEDIVKLDKESDITVIRHDVDDDGVLTVNDIKKLGTYVLCDEENGVKADINGDGQVNVFDYQRVKKQIIN